ncbi:MAG: YicC/YloC family endoribonuclease [Paracoccaceae bacterium]
MTTSMTGFAAAKGQGLGYAWAWDIRSVNGKGLDLRLRVPDWIDGLEATLRADLARALNRGNVSLSLKVSRDAGEAESIAVNTGVLAGVLAAISTVEQAAMQAGVTLAQATAADVALMRGVLETGAVETDTAPLRAALLADLPGLLSDFAASRLAEGAALGAVIAAQLDTVARLTAEAAAEAQARRDAAPQALREALTRLLANAEGIDETRLAQELALLAVKQDVTEELDRLTAHTTAARALLADPGPVGRKFDFLMQEFMREANTLCSKAQALALTRIGLDLKTVIDQMREQVQNVE